MLGNEKEQTSLNYTNLSLCLSDDEVVPNLISPSALWFQTSHASSTYLKKLQILVIWRHVG